jgi:uncharacterized Zn finger protein
VTRRREEVGWATELLGRLVGERCDHGRMVRGAELFEWGRVVGLRVDDGLAEADVLGSRTVPYETSVRFAGGRPHDARELRFTCTCPDWGDPCKHGIALVLALAEQLDEHPELAERLWGQDREPRAAPRAARAATVPAPAAPLPTDPAAWAEGVAPARPATTVDEWLGGRLPRFRRDEPLPDTDADADEVLDALGRLDAGDGIDLAPAVRALVRALRDAG